MSVYWDTSCLLKLYCRESDSAIYLEKAEAAGQALMTSALTETELFYAFLQKESRGETGGTSAQSLFDEVMRDKDTGFMVLLPFGEKTSSLSRDIAETCYRAKPKIFLRSLDGLHLAAALEAGCSRVATTDERMKQAALELGIGLL